VDAVVVGGTGLVGRALLAELAADASFGRVTALARRPAEVPPRVEARVLDLATLEPEEMPPADAGFCCLGTTIKVAGSQEAFHAVDHGLVLRFARACHDSGVSSFHVVSALGADPGSRVFYNRVKGEMERDVAALGFPTLCVYRPSLLLGERQEKRPGERVGTAFAKALRPLIPATYRGVQAEVVARAMARHAKEGHPGANVHESGALLALAGQR
jgi:uncharacterized protein YbjT (DUF2867 family)